MSVQPVPEGYGSVTPYLTLDDTAAALEFYKAAFGAIELFRMPMGDRIGHAEMKIGNSHVMLSDEFPEIGVTSPKTRGGATSSLLIYLEDVDVAYARAVQAGATAERPPRDEFWGDRMGALVDPFGHRWSLATHIEDVSEEEMGRRMAAMAEQMGACG